MTKLSRIFMFLVCLLTSGTWLTQAHGQAIVKYNIPTPTGDGGFTTLRGPSGLQPVMRGVAVITSSEMTALGASASLKSLGFSLRAATGVMGGTLNVYMLNTTDVLNTRGLDWSVAITGMTQVCNAAPFNVAVGDLSYDVLFNANGNVFNYTGGGLYVAYDFSITTPALVANTQNAHAVKIGPVGAVLVNFYQGPAGAGANTLASNANRLSFRIGVDNLNAIDLVVDAIKTPAKVSLLSKAIISARILNRGTSTQTNVPVVLTIGTFTDTQIIPTIAAGGSATATFVPYTPNSVSASIPVNVTVNALGDANLANNTTGTTITLQTGCTTDGSLNNGTVLPNNGIGFGAGGGILVMKNSLAVGSSAIVNSINVKIGDATTNTGNVIQGVVLNSAGDIVAVAAPYTILLADIAVTAPAVNFVFTTPATIPAGEDYFIGVIQAASTAGFSPVALQSYRSASPAGPFALDANGTGVIGDLFGTGPAPAATVGTNVAVNLQTITNPFLMEALLSSPITTPTLTASVAGPICFGIPVTFTATTGLGTYDFKVNGTTVQNTTSNVLTTTTLPLGTNSVTVSVDGCPSPLTSNSISMVVNASPTAPTISGTTVACVGPGVTLLASAPSNWYATATSTVTLNTAGTTASFTTPALTGTVTYFAEIPSAIPGGCNSPRTPWLITVTNPSVTVVNAITCPGNTATITASLTNVPATGTPVFNWYAAITGGTILFTGASFTTPPLAITTNYFVDATINGCTTLIRAQVTVTVATPVAPTVSAVAPICSGSTATLTAPGVPTGTTVSWFTAATGGTAVGTGVTFTTLALTTGTTYFAEASVSSCVSATRTPVAITVNASPVTPVVTASVASVCTSGSSILTATNVPTGATVNWYTVATGGTAIANTSGNTLTVTATGTYFAEYTANTCVGMRNVGTTFTINTVPAAAVITGSLTPAIVSNNIYTVPTQTGITYVWSANGGGVVASGQGTNSATITWATTGAKVVTLVRTNAATCTTTSTLAVTTADPVSAIDASLSNLVKVSPNPSNGDFNVDFNGMNMGKSVVRVYDAQGKTVFSSEVKGNLMTISLEKFANGIYLMEVETSKGRILKRLAKQ